MDIKTKIRIEQAKRQSMTDSEIAQRCDWSKANYSNKLKRGNFNIKDLEKIANALNCDLSIEFVERK